MFSVVSRSRLFAWECFWFRVWYITNELVLQSESLCVFVLYYHIKQWFSNFLHQVPPQKIFGFLSTTIMTNIKMQYKWLPTAPGVCSLCVCVCVCVCVFTAVCVCTLDGLNAEHKFWVCHVTFTFSSTIQSKKKKKKVSFNPYKDIYYCQPLKI